MVDSPKSLRADVCVVGAGPAGLTLAHELSTRGYDVLVLEAGPGAPPTGGVDVPGTTSTGLRYSPATTRSSGVGGSALRWNVVTPRPGPHVRLRELDDGDLLDPPPGATGWPLGPDDLAPFYARARQLLHLPERPEEVGGSGRLEAREYVFAAASRITVDLPSELRKDPRVQIVPSCTVTGLESMGEPPEVTRLACVVEGRPAVVEARAYVLAAGALENARLLLASRSQRPAGLGNEHDLVGRHFMEHPHVVTSVVRLPPHAPMPKGAVWDVHEADGVRQTMFALPAEERHTAGLLNAAWKLKPGLLVPPYGLGRDGGADQALVDAWPAVKNALQARPTNPLRADDIRAVLRGAPQLVRHAVHRVRPHGSPRLVLHVHVMAEQEPSPLSRLRLRPEPDDYGVPTAELHWRLSELDQRSMALGQRLVSGDLGRLVGMPVISLLGADGAREPEGGAHHMGTTRMALRPADGVVDEHCRVHEVRNLWVAGSSVFPRAGAANPTLTIVALAIRLAGRLDEELGTPRITAL